MKVSISARLISQILVLVTYDLLIGGDPFVAAIRGNAFTRTMSEQLQMEQIKDESANVVTKVTEQSFASQLQQKLIEALGEVKFRKGMEFLLGSTMLADEMVNEDHLLDMIEEIIGIENLQYLEDMYQLLTYSNAR